MNGRLVKFPALAFTAAASLFANTYVTVQVTADSISPYTGIVGNTPDVQLLCDDPYDILTTSPTLDNVLFLNQLNSSTYLETRYGAAILANQGNNVAAAVTLATKLYDEVAYLALQFGSDSAINSAIQIAVWHVFDNLGITATDVAPAQTGSPNSKKPDDSYYWYNLATSTSGIAFGGANASIIEILTPSGALGVRTSGSSQEFIVVSPEPATYMILGSGLIVLSWTTFRRGRNRDS